MVAVTSRRWADRIGELEPLGVALRDEGDLVDQARSSLGRDALDVVADVEDKLVSPGSRNDVIRPPGDQAAGAFFASCPSKCGTTRSTNSSSERFVSVGSRP